MKLTMHSRKCERKTEPKAIRREGNIPAVLYTQGRPCESITIQGVEFNTALRKMKSGHLPTTVFTLVDGKKERKAIVKDIQYHPTTYVVSHLDFEELVDGVAVSVNVPIECVGEADCPGVKLGGFLRQVIRTIKVECQPKHIPSEFVVDVKDLGIRQSKRLRDIPMPHGVKPLASLNEVVAVIAKR